MSNNSVLVIGGGIAGIQAAIELGERRFQVYLVEKEPSIGGRMAQLDKTFPTNDCSICILAPKMNECYRHPNVKTLTYSEVKRVDGTVGNFNVEVIRKPRYVDESKCTGCRLCAEKCPVKVPDEFDAGLKERKAIYMQFMQAVPRVMTIDEMHCLHFTKGKCGICKKNCQADAINYEQKPQVLNLKVDAIIAATGFDIFNPKSLVEYGYGKYKNVITAMEYERLISASGPTKGHLQRPSDGLVPKKLAFIQCVGSRDVHLEHPYCCSVCCMHATKEAILAKEHYPELDIYIFYTDLRAFGKGFQDYIKRAKEEYKVKYIRARPGEITEDSQTSNLTIWYDDISLGTVKDMEVELVILATTLIPRKNAMELTKILGIDVDQYGFFETANTTFAPVDTKKEGIFVSGYCSGPKDIPESVAQATGATARVAEVLSELSKRRN